MKSISDREHSLNERLVALEVRLSRVEQELDQPHSRDWEDAAIEREGDEVLEDLGASGLVEIARIRAALSRIADGSYGICVTCGNEIADKRLDLVPDTPFCRNCAQ